MRSLRLLSSWLDNNREAEPPTPRSQAEPGNDFLEALPLVANGANLPGNDLLEALPLVANGANYWLDRKQDPRNRVSGFACVLRIGVLNHTNISV